MSYEPASNAARHITVPAEDDKEAPSSLQQVDDCACPVHGIQPRTVWRTHSSKCLHTITLLLRLLRQRQHCRGKRLHGILFECLSTGINTGTGKSASEHYLSSSIYASLSECICRRELRKRFQFPSRAYLQLCLSCSQAFRICHTLLRQPSALQLAHACCAHHAKHGTKTPHLLTIDTILPCCSSCVRTLFRCHTARVSSMVVSMLFRCHIILGSSCEHALSLPHGSTFLAASRRIVGTRPSLNRYSRLKGYVPLLLKRGFEHSAEEVCLGLHALVQSGMRGESKILQEYCIFPSFMHPFNCTGPA